MAVGKRDEDDVVLADMDLDMIREVRNVGQFFRDRRPESDDALVQPSVRLSSLTYPRSVRLESLTYDSGGQEDGVWSIPNRGRSHPSFSSDCDRGTIRSADNAACERLFPLHVERQAG
jgi:hypothetical protein